MIFREKKEESIGPKLKTQLILSFMIMFLLLLSFSSFLVYRGILNILEKRLEDSVVQQFHQIEFSMNTFFSEIDKVSKIIILDDRVQEFLAHRYVSEVEEIEILIDITNRFEKIRNNYSYIDSIYIFSEYGEVVGVTATRNNHFSMQDTKHKFYSADSYQLAQKNFPKLVWTGGNKNTDFDENTVKSNVSNIISAVRGVKHTYNASQNGTLAINTDESILRSIYDNISKFLNEYMYIVDNNGKIISHTNKAKIGQMSQVFLELDRNKEYASFSLRQDGVNNQIIFYRLKQTGWTLINEVPYDKLLKDIITLRWTVVWIFIICIAVALTFSMYWIYRITRPLSELSNVMKEIEAGKLGSKLTGMPRNELGMIGKQFNRMSESIANLVNRNKVIEQEKRDREIEALQAQINPHFLYNTLNTIKWMAIGMKVPNIVESIGALGNILKPIFQSTSMLCTIEEEINYLENYIKIMNYRFGEGIKVILDIQKDILHYEIPRFILQPIIENSIIHGSKDSNYVGTILVQGIEHEEEITLVVSDSGDGMSEDILWEVKQRLDSHERDNKKTSKSIGLRNVNQRIKLYFGNIYGIEILSEVGMGTKVLLKLPKVQKM